ncbi:hypothetical protein [Streptomyces sp. NPDC001530]|uniref:hypothetical protein n=1 Tax=Streptomyces sp. NPDC001530 TaxID=3364582 RepID=UPI0036B4516D
MAITDDIRKAATDPTPLYFLAGTADLAVQQAKKVPGIVDQIRAEAPARIETVKNIDPNAVQEKATARAKEAQETLQAKVTEFISTLDADIKKLGTTLDTDLKKLGESAQDLALRGVGVAAEYAVKAREAYEKVAEHGEQTVKTWRGEAADEIEELAAAVEPKAEPVEVKDEEKPAAAAAESTPAKKAAAKKAPVRKTTAKKTTPPAK